jgi:surfeit locus 1 family protein
VFTLFNRRWWWTTLLVIAAVGVMARLGIWQLDRLAQRRAFNARVKEQIAQPPLDLSSETLDADLPYMEYRAVTVVGTYDQADEVALRNQVWQDRPGVHLLTPLVISGINEAVLVDRGWIPAEDAAPEKRAKYAEPGIVMVRGAIRQARAKPDFGPADRPLAPGEKRLDVWSNINVERIGQQVSYPLLPIYIQQAPDPAWTSLPYRSQPKLDLTEGPHFGYALQWFTFAAILAVGYPFYVRRRSELPNIKKTNLRSTSPEHSTALRSRKGNTP